MKESSYYILYKWLRSTAKHFPLMEFYYFFNEKLNTHYIAVFPEALITDEYCLMENDIFQTLRLNYPNEDFIFGTENKNFHVNDKFQSFTYNSSPSFDCDLDGKLVCANNEDEYVLTFKIEDIDLKRNRVRSSRFPGFNMVEVIKDKSTLKGIGLN